MAEIQVAIKDGKPPTTVDESQYELHISLTAGETVKWTSTETDWAIIFKDQSPFVRDYFVPEHPDSGTINVAAGPTKYKYSICVKGKKSDSPVIKVDP